VIRGVINQNLCTGCGTCVALCPEEAIELAINKKKGIYIPQLNEEKCNNCGICYKVCPGHEVNFKELNLEIFGKEPEDILIGNYLNCYVGHSTDHDIRYNSSSGGIVTQLLIFALEEGMIDGALVTRMKKDNPLEPEPFIARTREEVIEASKSKYCPVPANVALREILEAEEGEKFAVVGLPCHIHGMRKAENVNEKLKEKIVLHIGIFCGHSPSFLATEFLLWQMKISENAVNKLSYRGRGWPGYMQVGKKDGNKEKVKYGEAWSTGFGIYFFPYRCTLCCDGVCEFSDISFGDGWLPELMKTDKIGTSIIISKTNRGDKVLNNCLTKKKIELKIVDDLSVAESQKAVMKFKKKSFQARMNILRLYNKKVPSYTFNFQKPSIFDYFNSMLFYVKLWISSKHLWRLMDIYVSIRRYMLGLVGYYIRKCGLIK